MANAGIGAMVRFHTLSQDSVEATGVEAEVMCP